MMKPKACLFFAAFWMCCAVPTDLAAQTIAAQPQYRFQHYDVKEGLPSAFVESIAQDGLGFMWFQYFLGLSRFDGYNFRLYKHDPNDTLRSLPAGGIGRVFTDPNGNLWITAHTPAEYFPLARYDVKNDAFVKYRPGVKGTIVNRLCFDKTNPIIWFATEGGGLYSFNFETLETNEYVNDHADSLTRGLRNTIYSICDRDASLLIGSREGIWSFSKKSKKFRRPACSPVDSVLLYHTPVWDIADDPESASDDVWILPNGILLKVDKNFRIVHRFDFHPEFKPRGYVMDADRMFWFSTWDDKGLYRYSPLDSSFVNIANIPGEVTSLKNNKVNSVFVDKDQNIWIATDHGVSRLQRQRLLFHNFTVPGGMGESTVYHQGKRDYVIINRNKGGTQDILMAPLIPDRLDNLRFEKITEYDGILVCGLWKGKRNFWISLYGHGVGRLSIDSTTGMIMPRQWPALRHAPENPNTISSNLITFVWEDNNENLWVGTRGNGLNKVNLGISYGSPGSVERFKHLDHDPNSLGNDIIWNFYPENDKTLWLVTEIGVDVFRNDVFEHVFKDKNNPNSVYKVSDGTYLIGAVGGLYEGKLYGDQHKFGHDPILRIADVIRIQDDKLGRQWLSTLRGMICYDRHQQIQIEFDQEDGIDHFGAVQPWYREHQSLSGIMVISDQAGISLFDPLSLKINRAKTFPVFTALKVNNQVPLIRETGDRHKEFVIESSISVLPELVLDNQHNNFSIEFSAMEMTSPHRNLYRYRLDGYDKDWIETDWKDRTATYTNLDARRYLFRVKACNHHGVWSDQETTLIIRVLPPPWKTWWAYMLYGIALAGIFLAWRSYDIKRIKLKHRAEHLSELDSLKTRFFANISHEFRTPITLIVGPLKDLYNKANSDEQKTVLGTMLRNGQRLLRLINQLLDLSKLEAGKMTLQAAQTDLVQFLKEIASSYESLATDKKMKFFFYAEMPELQIYIDQEKMEKVVHNLLSNAFKFTNEGGEVILNLKTTEKHGVILVKDTGIGIPDVQLDKVFDRFYQVDSSQTRGYEGSGLGMALSKELVELHHGSISVESKEGNGSTFTIRLPLDKDHLRKEEIIGAEDFRKTKMFSEDLKAMENSVTAQNENEKTTVSSGEQPVLLIVEDNADMRHYIRKTMSDQYQIMEAENGKMGVKMAEESVPDLIISDIMMPEMDGFKLCELIKTNELTSHIPVILLTAKADRESKLTGLETGADDYLSKPFDADELKLIVRNRIEERRKMRERFSREITLEPKQISITSLDEKFLIKVLAIIEEHMDDENFSIDELSREVGYSNMHFYRKIKALAGQTPSQFLRTIRLKRAAELLSKNSDNVTQIAYSVGFNSLSYFNKCFREQFGVTPGQFADERLKFKV